MRSPRNAVCLMLLAGAFSLPAEAGKMYWTKNSCTEICNARIERASQDGSGASTVTNFNLSIIHGIALDPVAGDVYWSQIGPLTGILRADEESCEVVVPDAFPGRVRVDPVGRKLYWQSQPLRIDRSHLDGSARETVWETTATWEVTSFALDPVNAKLYIAESDYANPGERIVEMNPDGSGFSLVYSPEEKITDIAVDPDGGKLYWIAQFPNRIRRVDIDGSNDEVLLELDEPATTIAVDSLNEEIYWFQGFEPGEIRRADFDGTGVEVVVTEAYADHLALDPAGLVDVASIECSTVAVPALDRRGVAALVLVWLAVSGVWLGRR